MNASPLTLSVALAVADHQGAAAARTLATLDHPHIQPVLALHGRQEMRVEQAPRRCLAIQMGPCDAATARNRALGAAEGTICFWLRPGETLAPHAHAVLARAFEKGEPDAIFIPVAGTGAAVALRELADRLPADADQAVCRAGLWQQAPDSIRPAVSTGLLRAKHLHFPAGLRHSSLFFDRAALMLCDRAHGLDMPLLTVPGMDAAPSWRDLLSMVRALLALMPRTPGFADPALRLTALASLLGQVAGARAALGSAGIDAFDDALRQIWHEQDPRLTRLIAPEFESLAPELPESLRRALIEARALLP